MCTEAAPECEAMRTEGGGYRPLQGAGHPKEQQQGADPGSLPGRHEAVPPGREHGGGLGGGGGAAERCVPAAHDGTSLASLRLGLE